MNKLLYKVKLTGKIKVITGLHIGAGNEKVEIGGLDNPVVRSPLKDNEPYIPGSSLKGKIRSLLELAHGTNCVDNEHNKSDCPICKVFGAGASKKYKDVHGSRIIFRDAYLTKESKEKLEQAPTDFHLTEVKYETAIHRVTGTAKGGSLRTIERIPADAEFEFSLIVNVFENESEEKIKELLKQGIALLNEDYLGGSGSRGYGQIEMKIQEVEVFPQKGNTEDVQKIKKLWEELKS